MNSNEDVNQLIKEIGVKLYSENYARQLNYNENIIDIPYVLSTLEQFASKDNDLIETLHKYNYKIVVQDETMKNGFRHECILDILVDDGNNEATYRLIFDKSNIYALEWCPCEMLVKEIYLTAKETYNGNKEDYEKYKKVCNKFLYGEEEKKKVREEIERKKKQIAILQENIEELKEILI